MEAFRRRLRERAPPKLGSSYTGPAVTAGFAAQGFLRMLSVEGVDMAAYGCGATRNLQGRRFDGTQKQSAVYNDGPRSAPSPHQQVQALLAAVRRLNAEAVESAQQDAQVSAERDAAVADASRLRDDIQKVEEEKANLAAALDAVMDGAQIERRTARAKADAAQREIEALRKAIADAWSGSSAEEEAAMALCSEVADLRNSAATSAELGSVEVQRQAGPAVIEREHLAAALYAVIDRANCKPHSEKPNATAAEHEVAMLPEELEPAGDRLADANHGRIAGEHMAARCCVWDQLPSCAILTEISCLQGAPTANAHVAEPLTGTDSSILADLEEKLAAAASDFRGCYGIAHHDSGDCLSVDDDPDNSCQGSAGTEGDLLYADAEAAVNIIENVAPFEQLSKLCTPAHLLGSGTYGSVTLWRGPLPQFDMAVKQIACTTGHHVESVKAELKVLYAAAKWSHCVIGKGAFWAPGMAEDGVTRSTIYYLCMQPMRGGSLAALMAASGGTVPEVDAKIVGLCILRGLRDMHAGGYCHLDVKPDNVSMAEEGNLRTATLLDYGSAKPIDTVVNWLVGSAMYASPCFVHAYAQQLAGCAPPPVNLAKADSYSVGVTLFEALTGRMPVPDAVTSTEEASVHFRRQARGDEPDPTLALCGVSESGRDLLSRLLDVDDDRRISVQDAMQHPWFSEVTI